MCGIAGWVGAPPDDARLAKALASMHHRGPDGEGRYVAGDVSLGHRRLAIVDLDPRAAQPMTREHATVVFNGEIYNFVELRSELGAEHFSTASDTEVLLQGYLQWGLERLLPKLHGMFAFALWDARQNSLHLVRDRLGKKPLYFCVRGGTMAFASTVSALRSLQPEALALNMSACADYLHYLAVPNQTSIFQGIEKVQAGEWRTWCQGQWQGTRLWYVPPAPVDLGDYVSTVEAVDSALRQAVAVRLRADVPLAVFLSGGIDSSLIAAYARDMGPLRTISAGFDDVSLNELPYATAVSQRLGSDHQEVRIDSTVTSALPRLVSTMSEPLGDPAVWPTALLSQAVSQHTRVVLTGDGGDESFAGYPSALLAYLSPWYQHLPASVREALPVQLKTFSALPGAGVAARRLLRLALCGQGSFQWRFDMLGERAFRAHKEFLLPAVRESRVDSIWEAQWQSFSGSLVQRVQALERATQLQDLFLPKLDIATMAHGVEARSPFLDHRVIEASLGIAPDFLFNRFRPKAILRDILTRRLPRPLPASLFERRKAGFSVPTAAWFRGALGKMFERCSHSLALERNGIMTGESLQTMLSQHRLGAAHGGRLWALLILELWLRQHVENNLSPETPLDAVA